jgi:hydrogenase maturation protease
MSDRVPLLVLGLGNLICRDDGLGIAAVNRLGARYESPEGVTVMDGGTLGLSLLPCVEDADRVIIVDAIRADQPAGSLVRIDDEDVMPAVAARLSPHQVGVADLLDGARLRGRMPPRLVLWGLVPERIDLGLELSPCVEIQLPALVHHVIVEAAAMGFVFEPRHDRDPASIDVEMDPRALADGVGLRR